MLLRREGIIKRIIEEREELWQERDTFQHHLEELGDDQWDVLKEERQLLRKWVKLLEDSFAAMSGEVSGEAA